MPVGLIMSRPLDLLRSHLHASFALGTAIPEDWTDGGEMRRTLEKIRSQHDTAAIEADSRSISNAIAEFRRAGKINTFRELKYVCLGIAKTDAQGWCLLLDAGLRFRLNGLIEAETQPRRQIKCFQAMLSSFWSFPDDNDTDEARDGWNELREWLNRKFKHLEQSTERKPGWFATLAVHINLLGKRPCERYAQALLSGDPSDLNAAILGLSIPTDSWVQREAIHAQIRASVGMKDAEYKALLPTLIATANGTSGVAVSKILQRRCIALLVARYARCSDRAEHILLRDTAVSVIGNPWLRRAAWDAAVVNSDGHPDDDTREMVNGWLKRRLITDFFELLSVDGAGDRRRVEYWLRFEPAIDDMWFALGTDTRSRRGELFKDFRHRAKGRLLFLEKTTSDNNAFIMRMGDYLAVEFGAKGNAFFLFKWESLSPYLSNALTSGRESASVDIGSLKPNIHEERLIHMDSSGRKWEQKFDASIRPRIGWDRAIRPATAGRPLRQPVTQPPENTGIRPLDPKPVTKRASAIGSFNDFDFFLLANGNGLNVMDNRSKGGALWVMTELLPPEVEGQLMAWGFKLKQGKGWYRG